MKTKMKVALAIATLCYAPLTIAGDKAAYPTEKVAQFIVDKLDITSLPAALRPKKEKGKRTFADYGFTTEEMDEREAAIQAAGGAKRLSVKVLDQRTSGIYACITQTGQNTGQVTSQSVVFLKRSDSNALLKGRESWREFASCPAVGATAELSGGSAGGD